MCSQDTNSKNHSKITNVLLLSIFIFLSINSYSQQIIFAEKDSANNYYFRKIDLENNFNLSKISKVDVYKDSLIIYEKEVYNSLPRMVKHVFNIENGKIIERHKYYGFLKNNISYYLFEDGTIW